MVEKEDSEEGHLLETQANEQTLTPEKVTQDAEQEMVMEGVPMPREEGEEMELGELDLEGLEVACSKKCPGFYSTVTGLPSGKIYHQEKRCEIIWHSI